MCVTYSSIFVKLLSLSLLTVLQLLDIPWCLYYTVISLKSKVQALDNIDGESISIGNFTEKLHAFLYTCMPV